MDLFELVVFFECRAAFRQEPWVREWPKVADHCP